MFTTIYLVLWLLTGISALVTGLFKSEKKLAEAIDGLKDTQIKFEKLEERKKGPIRNVCIATYSLILAVAAFLEMAGYCIAVNVLGSQIALPLAVLIYGMAILTGYKWIRGAWHLAKLKTVLFEGVEPTEENVKAMSFIGRGWIAVVTNLGRITVALIALYFIFA